jgi:Conserved hypothetical protein (DUF2461)
MTVNGEPHTPQTYWPQSDWVWHLGSNYMVCSPRVITVHPAATIITSPTEPVFRQAETEFKLFVEKLTDLFPEVDPQIPPLPPKDVIYRIYRDVRPKGCGHRPDTDTAQIRFSNDKTPYKTNFAATFSRSGRKGIFAGCMSSCSSLVQYLVINVSSLRSFVRFESPYSVLRMLSLLM